MLFRTRSISYSSWITLAALMIGVGTVFFSGRGVRAQAVSRMEAGYRAYRLGVEDGMPSGEVGAVEQDEQGFLWVGTSAGFARYDGYEFQEPPVLDPAQASVLVGSIETIVEDPSGGLWVGASGPQAGLARLHPDTGALTTYRVVPGEASGSSRNEVYALTLTRAGVLWVGTGDGLSRLDPVSGRLSTFHLPDSLQTRVILALLEDQNGTLWIGSWAGLYYFDEASERIRPMSEYAGGAGSFPPVVVRTIQEAPDGGLWVGTFGDGLYQVHPSTGQFMHVRPHPGDARRLPHSNIEALLVEDAQHVWVGTWTGLCRLHVPSQTCQSYLLGGDETDTGLMGVITSLARDRTGILWVGMLDGLYKLVPARKSFHSLPPGTLREQDVQALYVDEEQALWVGSGSGLDRLVWTAHGSWQRDYSVSFTEAMLPRDRTPIYVHALTASGGDHLWIGTADGGVLRMNRRTGRFSWPDWLLAHPELRALRYVQAVLQDRWGNVWIGTPDQGLFVWLRGRGEVIRYHAHADSAQFRIAIDHTSTLIETRTGDVWAGLQGGGLIRFYWPPDHHRSRPRMEVHRHDPNNPESPGSDIVYALHEDDRDRLWVGTMAGLSLYDPREKKWTAYASFGDPVRLDAVCVVTDLQGVVWAGTRQGMVRFDPSTGIVQRYTIVDGLPGVRFNMQACSRRKDGQLVFGTKQGLLFFHPETIRHNPYPPPIVFTRIVPELRRQGSEAVPHLNHWQHTILFEYAALDFSDPSRHRYAYRLDGVHEDWVNAGSTRRVEIANLKPGTYTMRVRGTNNDGLWSTDEAVLRFSIRPPFWQRWWFFGIIVLGIGAVLGLLHSLRMRHLLRLEQTRRRIADDLHDDIGSSLNSIALFLEGVGSTVPIPEQERNRLLERARSLRLLTRDLRDTVWMVEPEYDDLSALVGRMRRHAEDVSRQVQVTFQAPAHIPARPLAMDRRRHVFLLYKEALHNALRHADASAIRVTVSWAEDRFAFTVEDDGIGFDPELVRRGRGLRTMQERGTTLGAHLTIHSAPGRGTTVHCSIRMA